MRPTQILRAAGGESPLGKHEKYLGGWGNFGSCADYIDGSTADEFSIYRALQASIGHGVRWDYIKKKIRGTNVTAYPGGMKQRGIISYAMSPNRQNPLAGATHAAIFNSWRRFRYQVLYWAPPLVFFYYAMNWATERYGYTMRVMSATESEADSRRNEYLNSKAGRKEFGGSE
ncbi:hypothetical protein DL764_007394 [Monosporascus ibericus]|uniref:Cytochrome b-c1 complex subunit 8 n=1 Tax=Monosporascus ibericus TaxID=155417 RepID=A0A4Q4T0X7_9PEZI|nr:hypothetical protein DL764_007394 [Monosporascus ibericus]